MLLNNSDFINTSITKYLEEMIISFGHRTIVFEMQPLVSYLLSTTLLQMTGFLEKKLDLIMWELGSYDFDIRYDVTRNHKVLSSSYDSISEIYKYFKDKKMLLLNYWITMTKHLKLIK